MQETLKRKNDPKQAERKHDAPSADKVGAARIRTCRFNNNLLNEIHKYYYSHP